MRLNQNGVLRLHSLRPFDYAQEAKAQRIAAQVVLNEVKT